MNGLTKEEIIMDTPKSNHLSAGFRVGDLIFTSGNVGRNPDTGNVPDTIEEQTKQVLENIKKVLMKTGASMKDVVKTTVFLPDMDNYLNELFGSRLAIDNMVEFEVGIGAGGSEVVIAQGHMQLIATIQESGRISFNNVRVPASSRLAIRVRDNVAPAHAYLVFLSLNS